MRKIKNIFLWLKRYWYIPLLIGFALFGVVVNLLHRRYWKLPHKLLDRELIAIQEGEQTAKELVDFGEEKAIELLEERHQKTIEELDEKQKQQAEFLRKNPEALSRYLMRIAHGKRSN